MLPFSKKALKYQMRRNATMKGLFGGNKLWLAVFLLQRAGGFKNKLTKGGEMPIEVSEDMKQGGIFAIIHNPPPPTKKQLKKEAKAIKKANKRGDLVKVKPTKRSVRKSARAAKKANKRTKKVEKRLVKPTVVEIGLDR